MYATDYIGTLVLIVVCLHFLIDGIHVCLLSIFIYSPLTIFVQITAPFIIYMELFKIYLAKIALHFVFFVAVYFCNVKSGYFVGSSVILILYNVVPLVYTIRKEKEYEKYHMHKKYYIPKSLFLFFIAIEFVIQIITNIIVYKTYHNDLIIFVCLLHVLLSCFLNFFRNKETKIAKKAKKIGQENKRMLGSIIKDGRYVLKKGENVQLLNVFDDQALVRKFDGEEYLISISMVDSIDKSESSSSNTKK